MTYVDLVNFELGYTSAPRRVQGYSTKSYGASAFSRKYNAHCLRLTVDQYNAAARDLARAWHQANRKWVPILVQEEPEIQTVDQGHQEENAPSTDLASMRFFTLKSLAVSLGLNPDMYKGNRQGLIAAIERKQANVQ